MINLSHIDHVVLRAREPKKLIAFYCDVLGCCVERELDIGLVQLRAGQALIDIVPMRDDTAGESIREPNLDHFCLRVEPFEEPAIRSFLVDKGIEVSPLREVYGADGFGPSIYVEDPEGNRIELKGSPTRGPLAKCPV